MHPEMSAIPTPQGSSPGSTMVSSSILPVPMGFTVVILPGTTLDFAQLPPASIALDGAVVGCQLDPTGYRFSFDHHAGLRFHQLSTCEQVCLAIGLGLDPQRVQQVFINDLDRDVAGALYLLRHPQQAARLRDRVAGLGRCDSHGPGAPGGLASPELQAWMPGRDAVVDQAAVDRAVTGTGAWLRGELAPATLGVAQGEALLLPSGQAVPAPQGAAGLYAQGHLAFVLLRPLAGGRWHYTVCKRSDFHPFPITALAARMAALEPGWGGTSTLLGSPRPGGSALAPDQVARMAQETWNA